MAGNADNDDLYQTDENDLGETPEEAIEHSRTETDRMFVPTRDGAKAEQDYDTPAQPVDDNPSDAAHYPADHPERDYDTDQDRHERYDEGSLNATGATDFEERTPTETILPLEPADETDAADTHNKPTST